MSPRRRPLAPGTTLVPVLVAAALILGAVTAATGIAVLAAPATALAAAAAAMSACGHCRADRARAASEERWRSIVMATGDGVLLHDADGLLRAWNDAAVRLVGPLSEGVRGLGDADVVLDDDAPLAAADRPAERALADASAQRDVALGIRRPGGGTAWVTATAVPLRATPGGAVTGVVTTLSDVTALHRRAADERALGILAAAATAGEPPLALADIAARAVADMLQAPTVRVTRFAGDGPGAVLGRHGADADPALGGRSVVAAVTVGGVLWGAISAHHLPPADGDDPTARLRRVADLLGIAVARGEDRAAIRGGDVREAALGRIAAATADGVSEDALARLVAAEAAAALGVQEVRVVPGEEQGSAPDAVSVPVVVAGTVRHRLIAWLDHPHDDRATVARGLAPFAALYASAQAGVTSRERAATLERELRELGAPA